MINVVLHEGVNGFGGATQVSISFSSCSVRHSETLSQGARYIQETGPVWRLRPCLFQTLDRRCRRQSSGEWETTVGPHMITPKTQTLSKIESLLHSPSTAESCLHVYVAIQPSLVSNYPTMSNFPHQISPSNPPITNASTISPFPMTPSLAGKHNNPCAPLKLPTLLLLCPPVLYAHIRPSSPARSTTR